MIASRVVTVGPTRAPRSLAPCLLLLVALAACSEALLGAGSPCSTPFQCQTGLCLARASGERLCARRCAASAECGAGEVCGRFDFRGRDDAGVLMGSDKDIARVCRAPLPPRCPAACGCAQPCDDVRDCPPSHGCDLTAVDGEGHGACLATADGAVADAADCGTDL